MRVPFSPQLADLQPQDAAQKFAYSELRVVLWIAAGEEWSANTGGLASLYGSDEHPNGMRTLNPGESVRIIGEGKFSLPADDTLPAGHPLVVDHLYPKVSLYRTESLSTPTATAIVSREVCLKNVQGKGLPISLTTPNQ